MTGTRKGVARHPTDRAEYVMHVTAGCPCDGCPSYSECAATGMACRAFSH